MFFIIISVIFFICLLAGCGSLCGRCMRIETDNPWLYPFLGMFAAGTLFAAVSMFLPLNNITLAIFILVGLAGLPLWRSALHAWHLKHSYAACGIFWALLFACTLVMASRFAYTEWMFRAYDTDLYHANTIRWINEYGTPPGLANLHTRLGKNSNWLNLSALFDNGFWDNRIAWVMPTLLYSCTIAYLIYNILFRSGNIVRLFCVAMLFFTINLLRRFMYPSLDYDLPALFINMMIFAECLAQAEKNWQITPRQASLIICMTALAFAMKPLTGITLFFATGFVLYGLKRNNCLSIVHVCWIFAPAAVAGIVWMARNALLSGYPLFPLSLLPLPSDWTTPKQMVVGTYEAIIGFARTPGPGYEQYLHNWDWIAPWLKRHTSSGSFWFAAGLPLLAAIPLWIKILSRKKYKMPMFFGVWVAICLLYWFVTAPDLRFGIIFFQIFFSLGIAFAFYQTTWIAAWEARCANFLQNRRSYFITLTVLLFIATSVSFVTLYSSKRSIFHVGSIPSRELSSRILDATVSPPVLLFFPASGDQCGNSPLPCAPWDDPRLRMRIPGDIGGGFYID